PDNPSPSNGEDLAAGKKGEGYLGGRGLRGADQLPQPFPALHVPHPDRPVNMAGNQELAVRRKDQCEGRRGTLKTFQFSKPVSGRSFQQVNAVEGSPGRPLAVRGKGNLKRFKAQAFYFQGSLPFDPVPNPDGMLFNKGPLLKRRSYFTDPGEGD